MERRKLTRIPFVASSKIISNHGAIDGEVYDLSIGGAFIKAKEKLAINSKVNIVMFINGTKKPPIDIKGTVNRNEKCGIAVKFNDYTEFNKKVTC